MNRIKRIMSRAGRVVCSAVLLLSLCSATAFADEAAESAGVPEGAYRGTTYQVTVYAGNRGTVNGEAAVRLENIAPDTEVSFDDIVVELTDGKYYAKGIRLAGVDNVRSDNIHGDEVVATQYYGSADSQGKLHGSMVVIEDTDLVVAYGVMANRVAYTVRYVDTEGNQLADEETFFGDIGDTPATAPQYIEGYLPQATLVTLTLSEDESKNIVTFTYARLATGTTTTLNPDGTVDVTVPDGSTATGAYTTTVTTPTTPATTTATGGANAAEDTGDAGATQGAAAGEATPLTTDAGTAVLDEDGTPLAQPDVERISDNENALVSGEAEGPIIGEEGAQTAWVPWVVAALVLAGVIAFLLVRGRKKDNDDEMVEHEAEV